MFWLQFEHALGRVRDADQRFQFEIRQNSPPPVNPLHSPPLASGKREREREKGGFEFEYVGRDGGREEGRIICQVDS